MDLNTIADPAIDSVLDLLVAAESAASGEAPPADDKQRVAWVAGELSQLNDVLRRASWDQHTTGVHLVRLLADLIEDRAAEPAALAEFVSRTIDGKRNAFRPYRVSQFLRQRYGVGITNHTVQRMLGLVADAGRRRAASKPEPRRTSAMVGGIATASGDNLSGGPEGRHPRRCRPSGLWRTHRAIRRGGRTSCRHLNSYRLDRHYVTSGPLLILSR